MKNQLSGLVYSTDAGKMCPDCRRAIAACSCRQAQARPVGPLRVSRESKGRGGKTVTRITGLALDADALAQAGKQLRTACGSGGTVKDGAIEVQGDHCETVMRVLQQWGHSPKRMGG